MYIYTHTYFTDLIVPEDKWGSDESGMSGYEDEAEMDLSNKKSNGMRSFFF